MAETIEGVGTLPDAPADAEVGPSFRKELEGLINRHSMENGSDTPDFILAEYLADCLDAFDAAVARREKWYGRVTKTPETGGCGEHPVSPHHDGCGD